MSENRDDERRQRQMDFIIEQQAKFTTDIDRLRESDEELRRILAGYMIESNERMARAETFAEQTAQLLYASLEGQEDLRRQVKLTSTTVDRLAEAVAFLLDRDAKRNNGANGSGGGYDAA
ncbi:MAG: hypothetical protein MSG64_18020 [Pyrinomonadaceae bacterium MAG19_C2-C3]|nr:hypothetical protein [Pyrinomonadaceae bacterium MAG19_C2-C3]